MNVEEGSAAWILRQLERLAVIFTSKWTAYSTIVLLQWSRISGIWNYRDLTSGDTASYFRDAYSWYANGKLLITYSPLYTAFYGSLLNIYNDAYFVTVLHRVLIVLAVAALVLAVMRRVLPPGLAWLVAAWWVVLPINFDSLYEVHLFATIPLLVAILLLAHGSVYARGAAVGTLLTSSLLVRNEHILAAAALILILAIRRGIRDAGSVKRVPWKQLAIAYAVPIILTALITGFFYAHAKDRGAGFYPAASVRHTLNVCQAYAFGYQQRHPEWRKSPWTECESLMTQTFGQPLPSFFDAFRRNPRAMLDHLLWNLRLVPNGVQLALFNATSGTLNPDYAPSHGGSRWALWASILLGLVWLLGVAVLARNWPFWWDTWVGPRQLAWTGMLCPLLMVAVVLLTQRPRPSYLFGGSILLMALTGFFLLVLAYRFRLSGLVERSAPAIAVLVFAIFGSSYYPRPGMGAERTLYQNYQTLIAFRPLLSAPGTVLLTRGYAWETCNYVGLSGENCQGVNYWELRNDVRTSGEWPEVLQRRGINVVYADEPVLADPKGPGLLTKSETDGWDMVGRQDGAGRNWVLLVKRKAADRPRVTVIPPSGTGSALVFEFVSHLPASDEAATTTVIINFELSGVNACYLSHDRGTGVVSLSSDDAKTWMPVTAGSRSSAHNGQCTVDGRESSIERTATGEIIRISLAFDGSFAGDKTIYAFIRGRSGAVASDWAAIGSWHVPRKGWFGFWPWRRNA